MAKFWAFPLTVALIVNLIATPVVGILAGIFAAILHPYWIVWRAERHTPDTAYRNGRIIYW